MRVGGRVSVRVFEGRVSVRVFEGRVWGSVRVFDGVRERRGKGLESGVKRVLNPIRTVIQKQFIALSDLENRFPNWIRTLVWKTIFQTGPALWFGKLFSKQDPHSELEGSSPHRTAHRRLENCFPNRIRTLSWKALLHTGLRIVVWKTVFQTNVEERFPSRGMKGVLKRVVQALSFLSNYFRPHSAESFTGSWNSAYVSV
jgi:hypothetical protein